MTKTFEAGQRVRLPGDSQPVTIGSASQTASGWLLFVELGDGTYRKVEIASADLARVEVMDADGGADPRLVIGGLWTEWMRAATVEAKATARATTPLLPYAHQTNAVYGAMLPQPKLRFLLADEPGTGKTIMAGMYLREMQRLGFVQRALVIAPAHLVEKWRADFERFFGGGLKRITASTVYEEALGIEHDLWITSLDLASVNPRVQEAIRPDRAGWDVVVVDEAHRMTLTAQAYYRLGQMMSRAPRVLLMTATPHRGKESLFRGLMHLVDPDVYPEPEGEVEPGRQLRPGSVHFLRRMKEDLVDYDGVTPLFKGRRAQNVAIPLNATEQPFYDDALAMVDRFFPAGSVPLARLVYGKRAASSLYALRETLERRRNGMGSANPVAAAMEVDPESEDDAERDLVRVVVEQSLSAREEKEELTSLIRQLDVVLANPDMKVSKWPRMVSLCLAANGIAPGNEMQVVVFTEYADTAEWLVEHFRVAGYSAERYSGRDLHSAREDVRQRFADRAFQVLVSTDAGNEGIDLQTAHVLVNWDIPWSLVRLEQRMGRIHRVGQTRDVELYNLYATGTREGDVLEVLLDNFVVAANRLEGKMFDSLSLVGELVGLDFGSVLAEAYASDDRRAAALRAVRALTATRLEQAARKAATEEDALRSAVDLSQAVAELQQEALERINPKIVEAYLARLGASGVLTVEETAAGPGILALSAGRGSALPVALGRGRALVATSGLALSDARTAGADISDALPLGPGDAPFRALINHARSVAETALYRGARLSDPTSVTDYVLAVYETEVREFAGSRTSRWPFLVRADAAGARRVRWEALANLVAGDGGSSAPHPGRISDAESTATSACADEQARRSEVLGEWVRRAIIELERLPSGLTSHLEDRTERVAARQRLESAVQARIAEIRRLATVEVSPPRMLGWAQVSAAGAPVDPTEADSEDIAMVHVAELLRAARWQVADVHSEGRGYDLVARKGREQRSVEVKGVWESASAQGIRMTGHELLMARQLGSDYWVYVIDHCSDGKGQLFGVYPDPADRFEGLVRDVSVVSVPGSALVATRGEDEPA